VEISKVKSIKLSSLKLVSLAGSGHHITSFKIDLVSYRQYNITVFTVLSMPYAKILTTVDIGAGSCEQKARKCERSFIERGTAVTEISVLMLSLTC
jgi:hypothetical protein